MNFPSLFPFETEAVIIIIATIGVLGLSCLSMNKFTLSTCYFSNMAYEFIKVNALGRPALFLLLLFTFFVFCLFTLFSFLFTFTESLGIEKIRAYPMIR